MFNQTRLFLRRKLCSPRTRPQQRQSVNNKRGPIRRGMTTSSGAGGTPSKTKMIVRFAVYGATAATLLYVANAFLPENRRFFKSTGSIQAREDKKTLTTPTTEKYGGAQGPRRSFSEFFADANPLNSQISKQEWQNIFNSVMAISDIEISEFANQKIAVSQKENTIYVFTTEDHPAFPAVVTRIVYEEGNNVRVKTIGYYSGSSKEFDAWWKGFLELNEQLQNKYVDEYRNSHRPAAKYMGGGTDPREEVRKAEKEKLRKGMAGMENPRKSKEEREELERKRTEEAAVHINVRDDNLPSKAPTDKEHASNAKEPLDVKEVIDPRTPEGSELPEEAKERVMEIAKERGVPTPELTRAKRRWHIVEHYPHSPVQDTAHVNEKGISAFTTTPTQLK